MELLFIHISKPYGALESKSFHLSSKYKIVYDDVHNYFTLSDNPHHLNNFFGKNITNVTCIIGENGVGKTTFLRYVKELYFERRNEVDLRDGDIIAYIKDENLIVHSSSNSTPLEVNILVKNLKYKKITYKNKPKIFDHLKKELTIYYSNNFDLYDDFLESEILYNTSTPFLSRTYNARINKEFRTKKVNAEQRFLLNELQRNRKFLQAEKSDSLKSLLKSVDYIEIIPISKNDVDYKNLIKSIDKLYPKISGTEKDDLKELINNVANAFYTRKKETIPNPKRKLYDIELTEIIIFEVLNKFIKSEITINDFSYVQDLFVKAIYNNGIKGYLTSFLRKIPLVFIESTLKWKEKEKELTKYFQNLDKLVDLLVYQDELWREFSNKATVKTNSNLIERIIECYFELPFSTNSIKLEWSRLSAGEESMITFFSRIDGALRLKSKNRNNILILIDEGDLYFHPEWQRRYLKAIFDFLKQYKELKFQIILTSHSPFILSDLPQDNVISFEKTEKGIEVSKKTLSKTFGGNIHELLIDKFFLKNGVIGAFADNKITALIKRVNNKHTTMQDKILIDEIGDNFLAAAIKTNLEDHDKN